MHVTKTILAMSLLGALSIQQASAHGLWTEERRGNIEVVYGHGAEDSKFKAEKVSGAWAYDINGKMIPVTVERLADHARLQPLSRPAVMSVALNNGMWSQTADKKWTNEGRTKIPGAVTALQTFKYSLAIYEPGVKLPTLKGLKLVIIPLADPLSVGLGKALPVQVLLDGKPLAGIKLFGDYRSQPDEVSATTDAQGRANVVVRNEGLNIIAAETVVKVSGNPDIDEQGLFTSLTFVGEAHHE
ncbi:nickel ABC transporter substrate-binding protein [Pseudomonas sp. S25]|uniref:Nickel ABC transporter substrate-binding protein n=1 Tax=Pseudomonas maioricensis TaxID=1766623 RepID=A0ABS9ZP02_9PSED|nr:DUF4198 domain-containing protein [Pseudomonas sp. S25]MCI8212310.1 nickel ABC transporter substrate-binding protein [Pseudomonas sp. S25]